MNLSTSGHFFLGSAAAACIGVIFASILCACSESFTDPRDGSTYKVVKIGEKVWMAENLNFDIPGSFCPEGDARKCADLGRLYTWEAAKAACPEGFRLPTKEVFDELVASVGGQPSAGNLKSTSGWFKKGNGSNEFGFAAFPAGLYNGEKFDGIGGYAYFWSATESTEEPGFAYYLYLDFSSSAAKVNAFVKGDARSVRCYR